MAKNARPVPLKLIVWCVLLGGPTPPAAAGEAPSYGQLPLHFEANRGQAHADVQFLARGAGYGVYLTASHAVLALSGQMRAPATAVPTTTALRLVIVGGDPGAVVTGRDELPGKANYVVGKDPTAWQLGVPTYAQVHYRDVYPGIDLVYYGRQGVLEYDFMLAPGADPTRIALRFDGAERLELDAEGDLVLHTGAGTIRQKKPVIYQVLDGTRREIDGGYVLGGRRRVGFAVAAYDRSQPLVIDPVVLSYATFIGGNGTDYGVGIATDAEGSVYTAGLAASVDFPTTSGAFRPTYGGSGDAFVAKLDPTGSTLVYTTFLGGSGHEHAEQIAVDGSGSVYVLGHTRSTDFPTTPDAVQVQSGGMDDVFVAKLDASGGTLVYATYLGGRAIDFGLAISLDASGHAHATGYTESVNFPVTEGAARAVAGGANDAFVTKLNTTGTEAIYSTYLGGGRQDYGRGVAIDPSGHAYVAGSTDSFDFPTTPGAYRSTFAGGWDDPFVTKLTPAGDVVYSTYLGGSDDDRASGIAVDANGNAYVVGTTLSLDFETTLGAFQPLYGGGAYDAYALKLDAAGARLTYSTYLGGVDLDYGQGIAIDGRGNAYLTGNTFSANFPTTQDAFQRTYGGSGDAFFAQLDATGSGLIYSSYLGRSGEDWGTNIALDDSASPDVYVAGYTSSPDFATANAFQPTFGGGSLDAFVAKIGPATESTSRFEESAVAYTGSWPTYGSETGTFSGGTVRASNQTAATATFYFTGTAVTWIGTKCNVCGRAAVSIDGGIPTVVDTFGPAAPGSLTSEPVFSASGLAPDGIHALAISVMGAGGTLPAGGAYVAVDAFDVTR
ncbi:MAG TPA: SBBP repeat-containing protein [Gammaproteobacteria bacterium]|nr:SBBP repeat-containing protein [Gammaproteobacteria bacterium]